MTGRHEAAHEAERSISELLYLFQIVVWKIENHKTCDDAKDGCPQMAAAKERGIDRIEHVPDAAPHEHDPNNDRERPNHIPNRELVSLHTLSGT